MCEFCTQHGEGKKWYLTMRNYSRELLAQEGRMQYMQEFLNNFGERTALGIKQLDAAKKNRVVYSFIRRMAIRKQKAEHWGQVVPIEDVEQIVDLQDWIVRIPCICRSMTTGREARYCFGVGADFRGGSDEPLESSQGFEVLTRDEAKTLIRSFDKQGLVHSIWTFKTPYIGGICNCDQDCMAYRMDVKADLLQLMFRAEYVGIVDWELCNGCKKCAQQCQFGAIRYSNTMKKSTIEMRQCYGCGVCRAVCQQGAITLRPRASFAGLPW
jgi:NAD-dependent dihydropyrimidine dehydrogenase PreA subunit